MTWSVVRPLFPTRGVSHPDPRWRGGYGTHNGAQYRRVLSTNAIKDTVSVLYWYEELSSFDWQFLGRIFGSFFLAPILCF